jgi:hypothetical protein
MNNTSQVAVHWVMGITAGTLEVKGNQILVGHLTPSLFHIDEIIKTAQCEAAALCSQGMQTNLQRIY